MGGQRHSGRDTDPNIEQFLFPQRAVYLGDVALDLDGGGDGPRNVVWALDWHVEEREHGVIAEVVEDAIVPYHDVTAPPEELVHQRGDLH